MDSVEMVRQSTWEGYGAETHFAFPQMNRVSSWEFAVLSRKGGREGGR